MSLFELPVSRGARMARVVAVLLLDLVLAGAGIAMILSYLDDRAQASARAAEPETSAATPAPGVGEVDVLEPDPVDAEEVRREPSKPARKIAKRAKRTESPRPDDTEPPSPSPDPGVALPEPSGSTNTPPGPVPDTDMDTDVGAGSDPGGGGGSDTGATTGPGASGEETGTGGADEGTLEPDPADEGAVEFSAARVRRVVDRHRLQLQKCYQRATKSASPSKPLEGRVDIQFVIMPDGTASNVRPVANTTGSDQLAECVKGLIEGWEFPSPGAEEIAFVWPFVFKAP